MTDRFESGCAEDAGNQVIEPLFLKQPHPAQRIAYLLIAFAGLVYQVRQGLAEDIEIRCINNSDGVRQVLGNGRGPVIEAMADMCGRLT